MADPLRVVILKPSKYTADGYVERFRWGFMPNSTVPYMRSMTPAELGGTPVEVHTVDEYVHTDLGYLSLLERPRGGRTLLALVGVQSHQFHRALDLAAYARRNGCLAVIGGPHVMTCDTSMLHGRGVSFALAEAELVWPEILDDAVGGELRPVYGADGRWQQELEAPVVVPPGRQGPAPLRHPDARTVPGPRVSVLCNFCSVIKIAGRRIRSQSIATTLASLRAAKAAGVRTIMFTSDNFNKYPEAEELLDGHGRGAARAGVLRAVRYADRTDRSTWWRCWPRPGASRCSSASSRSTARPCWRPRRDRTVRRRTATLCDCAANTESARTFPTSSAFPQDTERDVDEHLEMLRELGPTWASFYILCPIPGTEQYDDFLAEGLITEDNLDRFDTTCLTWRHPYFSREQLAGLLFRCYRKFYSSGHAVRNLMHLGWLRSGVLAESVGIMAMSLFNRYCAWRRTHPMSGGVMRRAAGPRGRLPPAAQGRVRLRAGSAAAQPAIVGGGQLAEPGHQSACAGEFSTRNRPVSPSLIRSSSRGPIVREPGMDARSRVGPGHATADSPRGPLRGPFRRGTGPHYGKTCL